MFKIENLLLNKTIKPMYGGIESIEMRNPKKWEVNRMDGDGWGVSNMKYVIDINWDDSEISYDTLYEIRNDIKELVLGSLGYDHSGSEFGFYNVGLLIKHGDPYNIIDTWML